MDRWQEDLLYNGDLRKDLNQLMKGETTSVNDQDIAFDLLKDSKFAIQALAKALSESPSPKVRELLLRHFNECANEHFRLSSMAANNGWCQPYALPAQHLQQYLGNKSSQ